MTSAIQHQRGISIRRSPFMRKRKRNILSKSGLRDSLKKKKGTSVKFHLQFQQYEFLEMVYREWLFLMTMWRDGGNVDVSKCKSGRFRTARLLFHLFCFKLHRERNMSSVCVCA